MMGSRMILTAGYLPGPIDPVIGRNRTQGLTVGSLTFYYTVIVIFKIMDDYANYIS